MLAENVAGIYKTSSGFFKKGEGHFYNIFSKAEVITHNVASTVRQNTAKLSKATGLFAYKETNEERFKKLEEEMLKIADDTTTTSEYKINKLNENRNKLLQLREELQAPQTFIQRIKRRFGF